MPPFSWAKSKRLSFLIRALLIQLLWPYNFTVERLNTLPGAVAVHIDLVIECASDYRVVNCVNISNGTIMGRVNCFEHLLKIPSEYSNS